MKEYTCYSCDKKIDEIEAMDLYGEKWCEECYEDEIARAGEAQ